MSRIREIVRNPHDLGGEWITFVYYSEKIKPGTHRKVDVYVPTTVKPGTSCAVLFTMDGPREADPEIIERLSKEGTIPPMIYIGVTAAFFKASLEGGFDRTVRSPEYDGLGSGYADLLIDELLPDIMAELLPGYTVDPSPDMHQINGCSSGGICAWNACWERNDFFRRCLINSPTFSSFRGGDSMTVLMRKYEPRLIRCFMTVGTDDMENSSGNWYLEALSADAAMRYAGYEYRFIVFQNGKHGVSAGDPTIQEESLRFLWKDWQTVPVGNMGYPPRIADIVSIEKPWEVTDRRDMPEKTPCPYTANGRQILRDGKVMAELPGNVSGLTLSSDKWRLYAATPERRFVYAFAIRPDGSLDSMYAHAHLHMKDDAAVIGAPGICIDAYDRLYAATECGIQTTSQQGENNTILPLPGNVPCVDVGFDPDAPDTLYAKAADGRIFKRSVLTRGIGRGDETVYEPKTAPF